MQSPAERENMGVLSNLLSKETRNHIMVASYFPTAALFGRFVNSVNEVLGDPLKPGDDMGMGAAQAAVYGASAWFMATVFDSLLTSFIAGLKNGQQPAYLQGDVEGVDATVLLLAPDGDPETGAGHASGGVKTQRGCCMTACLVMRDFWKDALWESKKVKVVSFAAAVASVYFLNQVIPDFDDEMAHAAINVLGGGLVALGTNRTLSFFGEHCDQFCCKKQGRRRSSDGNDARSIPMEGSDSQNKPQLGLQTSAVRTP